MTGIGKITISAAIGGTAEALGGGKFANGAVTGAYVMALNYQGDMIVSRHKNAKGDFAVVRARTRNQALGNKETPFFYVRDLEKKEYYFYVMSPTEYESNTTECKFKLYMDGKGYFYLDQKLKQLVVEHYHTSYNDMYFFSTGSTADYNTSKTYNGISVYHMNTENFNVWEYKWSSDLSYDYIAKEHDRRKMPQFQQK